MPNPSYYGVLPASVRYYRNISGNAKVLYADISSLTNEKGFCWASNMYFAKRFFGEELENKTESEKLKILEDKCRTIRRWIAELRDANFIDVQFEEVKNNVERRIFLRDPQLAPKTQKSTSLKSTKSKSTTFPKSTSTAQENQGVGQFCPGGEDKIVRGGRTKLSPIIINNNIKDNILLSYIVENSKKSDRFKGWVEKYSPLFAVFYNEYPRKDGAKQAYGPFKRLNPTEEILKKLLKAIKRQKYEHDRELTIRNFDQSWPMAKTWLNNERWEDEPREIKEHVKAKSSSTYSPRTLIAWGAFKAVFLKYSKENSLVFSDCPEMYNVINALGGWSTLKATVHCDKLEFMSKRFMELFQHFSGAAMHPKGSVPIEGVPPSDYHESCDLYEIHIFSDDEDRLLSTAHRKVDKSNIKTENLIVNGKQHVKNLKKMLQYSGHVAKFAI